MNRRLTLGIGTAVAVLAAGGGIAALTWPAASAGTASAAETSTALPVAATEEPPSVQASIDALDLAGAVDATGALNLPQRSTKPFSALSVSWTDPLAKPARTVQVRTRGVQSGAWSGWTDLEVEETGADLPVEVARKRGATSMTWAGRSDGVALRVAKGTLPAGLKLNLIDPDAPAGGRGGGEPVPGATTTTPVAPPPVQPPPPLPTDDETEPDATTTGTPESTTTVAPPAKPVNTATGAPAATNTTTGTTSTTAPAATSTATVPLPEPTAPVKAQLPPYVSRAAWKANESLVTDPISVAPQAKMIWVHHTAVKNAADVPCADSAAMVRSLQANDVKIDGFSDMGYNFLVDKCGTLFEGRRGSATAAVIGAHTIGFNTGSVGVALIGTYTSIQPSQAALTTIAQVAAARLGAYGFNPASTTQMTEGSEGRIWPVGSQVTFPRIAGHKDGEIATAGYLTECPGTLLYPQLATIRNRSVQMITGMTAKSLAGGLSVSGTFYVRNAVTVNWAVDNPAAQIARFELVRDGKVAGTLPGTARTGTIALTPGSHTVAVRAVHVSGGTGITWTYKVIADVTAPAAPVAPTPILRTGTYTTSSVPVAVYFRITDNIKLYGVTALSPARVPLTTTATAWAATMRPGTNTKFTVTARDVPGNARTVSVTRKATILPETAAKRSGTWSARAGTAYLNGKVLAASKKGTKLTYTFTGRQAALLFSRGTQTGQADVYVDGKKITTIDTKATATAYRQAVWVRTLTATKHTVMIVVAGTSGRPTVISDGLAYIG